MAWTKENQAELDALEADPKQEVFSPAHQAELDQLEAASGPKSALITGIQTLGKGLDYLRGTTGGPYTDILAGKILGKQIVDQKNIDDALSPKTTKTYQSGSESLAKMGVPPGAHLSDYANSPLSIIPGVGKIAPLLPGATYAEPGKAEHFWQPEKHGFFDPNVRDVGGFAYDAARDPLSWMTLGGATIAERTLPALEKSLSERLLNTVKAPVKALRSAVKAPSTAVGTAGREAFEFGHLPLIQPGERTAKEVGPTLNELGIHGSSKEILNDVQGHLSKLNDLAEKAYQTVEQHGGHPDVFKAFSPMLWYLDELVKKGHVSQAQADKLVENTVGNYLNKAFAGQRMSVSTMAEAKSNLSKKVPDSARAITSSPGLEDQARMIGAGGAKDEVERVATDVSKNAGLPTDLGPEIEDINRKRGDLLSMMKPAMRESQKAARAPLLTKGDLYFSLLGLLGGGAEGAAMGLLGRRLIDTMASTRFRTSGGYYLRKAAENKLLSPAFDTWSRRRTTDWAKGDHE